ncbi:unnamed protein product [Coregonus sp. 'balchen']|nr:unnamed protein product [Coregonus sp. 'balchen']
MAEVRSEVETGSLGLGAPQPADYPQLPHPAADPTVPVAEPQLPGEHPLKVPEDPRPEAEPDTCPLPPRRIYSAVSWRQYFDQSEDISVGPSETRDVFRVYRNGSDGPLLVLLHGGGHSALSWAVFTTAIANRVTCRVLAMDLRGHGSTQVRQSDDLSTQTMSRDVANVVRACYGEAPPPIVLVGHSMGGAIAVHTASSMLLPTTVGLVVIDVVEGSAMEMLHSMQNFLKGRPKSFESIDHAIEWSVKSGQIRNRESARVSMAIPVSDVAVEGNEEIYVDPSYVSDKPDGTPEVSIPEPEGVYSWRIDLSKAEKYWDGWFRGISNLFLGCNLPKLLLLAGVDRLDRDLTIGQMQGSSSYPFTR